jgi:hypothetical protein
MSVSPWRSSETLAFWDPAQPKDLEYICLRKVANKVADLPGWELRAEVGLRRCFSAKSLSSDR